jgi:hypothetical protein
MKGLMMNPTIETIGKGLVALGWFVVATVHLLSWTAQVRERKRSPQE